jgi:hypothetical protein
MCPSIEEAQKWYESADPVHDFEHVMRVYRLSEKIALAEGADVEIVHAAALLHDSVGSAPGGDGRARKEHHLASDLRLRYWPRKVGQANASRLCSIAFGGIASAMQASGRKHSRPNAFLMPTSWMCWGLSASPGLLLMPPWPTNPPLRNHQSNSCKLV